VTSLTILVPTYQEQSNIKMCCAELYDLTQNLSMDFSSEVTVLFIDNFSTDNTFRLTSEYVKLHSGWSAVQLDRNYGVQASLLRGMSLVETDALLVFQSDLQDPIEVAYKLVEAWIRGEGSVIAGISSQRAEGFIDKFSRSLFYRVLSWSSDYGLQPWFHDFYLLEKRVYSRLYRQGFQHEFIRGRISEEFGVDFIVNYVRKIRTNGSSSFNLARKYSMALDGILRYGSKISRVVSFGSIGLVGLNLIFILILILSWVSGYRSPVQGWMSLACINLFILCGVGILIALVYEFLFRILRLTDVSDAPVIHKKTH
jgi:dolichol-phosphate mannosyltransferase